MDNTLQRSMTRTHRLHHEPERHAVGPRHFLREVEYTDDLIRFVRFEFFPRDFLQDDIRQYDHTTMHVHGSSGKRGKGKTRTPLGRRPKTNM